LRAWLLNEDPPKVIDLPFADAYQQPVRASDDTTTPGGGIAIIHPGGYGQAIARIAGPSAFKTADSSDCYLMGTTLILGDDYRVQWSSDAIYFQLSSPPMAGEVPIAAEEACTTLFAQSFPSGDATSPPVVRARIAEYARANVAWESCLGFWRGALVLDFGKGLPAFYEHVHALPARDFVAAISAAFRGRVAEIGDLH
jgi:hypothetical protein